MKILHIITGLSNGGAEASLYRLTTADSTNCHYVISLMDMGIYGARLRNAGVPVYALNMTHGKLLPQAILLLRRLIKSIKPDIVQTWMYHADLVGGFVARLTGIRNVIWGIRGSFDKKRTVLSTKIVIYLCALFSRWIPKAIITNSVYALQIHTKLGYHKKKFVVIPNGYPSSQFSPNKDARENIIKELDIKYHEILIGMVARFNPYKDHDNLFSALSDLKKKHRKMICLLVGPGMDINNTQLLGLLEKYNVLEMVKLIGPREDVHIVMAALDLHVLSSAAESFPNVLAEAMACGTPCVTTNVGDAALIVGDTGWVVPPSDSIALSDAILEAVNEMGNAHKWNIKKEACRKRIVENYTLERLIENYNRVWNKVINE